jgi:hypothetical protein
LSRGYKNLSVLTASVRLVAPNGHSAAENGIKAGPYARTTLLVRELVTNQPRLAFGWLPMMDAAV